MGRLAVWHSKALDDIAWSRIKNLAAERFVYYRLPSKADGDDALQEVYIAAYQRFGDLRDRELFNAWILRIAANKCNDFYRERARRLDIPIQEIEPTVPAETTVRETLSQLTDQNRQILNLYYFKNKPRRTSPDSLGFLWER